MTRGKILAAAAASSALMALASPASAAGFMNGSFEDNSCGNPGGFVQIGAVPGNCIANWQVSPHSVDIVGNGFWQAHSGLYSVDLAGGAPGSISQTFDTVLNGLYTVEYYIAGNPDGSGDGDGLREGVVNAFINNSLVPVGGHSLTGVPGTRANMNYRYQFFTFTAQSAQTTLTFASNPDEGAFGAVIDSVNVIAPVPEPATWAMMLLGFGAIGFGLRKRNAQGQSRLRVTYA